MSYKAALLSLGLVFSSTAVMAQTAGTADQAKDLLNLATTHYAKVGREQALTDFDNKQGPFVKGDLYVFCYGPDHTLSAHGSNMSLIGKDIGIFKDSDGQPFADIVYRKALADGEATIDYRWVDPISKKIQPKSSFVKKVADAEVCGVGFYKS